ncbi:phosphoribosylformylglycinamidine synthase subunit PurL [Dictyoglomus thermophilum]|uniref:Phosphoribosylformylglycinamidine synthase subunit PurL n=2 Tax=Dictyoglomus thermophilum TaxID=14 RepID=B5YF26_DICT6|nr:phosphoribosylformylglycinamidine synthase subunit PurL [Dictyoglomus thermophilum]ACI18678.1 phosphoribosylformylglycinamidine synthase II [Dictyoglomus thermophilum H-6-12]MCX7719948.1 phosphoribosylformylglycinamidine synthase subunit PurL [Dictyoglomus thermophilum]TYT22605.1 phosphoribosylformylglycinamidine synthase subunit PurL [Dictyoglomus thermophilum]
MGVFGLKEEEIKHAIELLGREPNDVEWSVISVIWSEHCSYKHSRKYLKDFLTKAEWVEQGPGENAGIINLGDGYRVVFKIESHNHPSAVEPFQGAATGVGGIVRDILAIGARPIALLDSLRFGPIEKGRNKYLFEGVVGGISFYGNCIGVPVVGGEIVFEDCYSSNPLVNVMCVGLLGPEQKSYRGKAEGKGNLLLLVGARTGRDGLQGASFASEKLDDEVHKKRPSVQVGDPFLGKLLIESCLEAASTDGVVGIQDLGAAGLVSSLSESARRGRSGVKVYLDKVPQREENMTAEEILLSESQERMLLVIRPEKAEEIISIFKKWDLEAEIIGEVIEEEKFIVYFKGEKVVDLPTELLVDGSLIFDPPYKEYKVPNLSSDLRSLIKKEHIEKFMNNAINDLSLKEKIYRQYDYSVQTNTVLPPGFGDASVLRIKGTNKGIAVVTDGNGRYCYLNPKRGAMYAVAEACRNILCVGGRPLAITDGLNFGDPDEPEVFYQFREVVKGINLASRTLEIPVVSGNVSFYNGQGEKKIFPTPIIGMVGVLEDLSYLIKPGLKVVGNRLYLIGDFSWLSLEGSRFIKDVFDKIEGEAPYVDLIWERKLKLFMEEIRKERDIIVSAHDVSEGGILVALLEMAFWGNKGVEVSLPSEKLDNLVGEGSGLIIVEVNKDREDEYMEFIKKYELKTHKMGEVVEKDFIIEPFIKEDINEFYQRR